MKPLVSIVCITCNHAPYIRQAIESIANQETDFDFEIIVHDDCSTDGTTDVVREFAEKYPDIIKPIIREKNIYSQGKILYNHYMNLRRENISQYARAMIIVAIIHIYAFFTSIYNGIKRHNLNLAVF